MELKKYKLGEYIDSFGDGIHGTPQYDDKGEYFFINGNNLKDGKIIITKDTLKITAREFEKIKRQLKPHNTVLVSINGTLGNVALYEDEKIALGKSACYLNLKNPAYRMFLRYILETNDFKKYMNRIAGQSTIKNVSPTQITEYEFFAPDFPFQEKIGAVLSIIDNKIALNKRLNAKLEQMAKRLYDYWFIQFDFPDKNGKPYKSSGGKMVWNEQLKREIPEGWEVKPVLEVFDWVVSSQPPKSTFRYTFSEGYIRFIQNRDYDADDHITYIPLTDSTRTCTEWDIMIDKYGDAGKTRFGISGAYNVALSKISVHDGVMREYIRSYLSSETIYNYLHSACMASTRASLNESIFDSLVIAVPRRKILFAFEEFKKSIIEKILELKSEKKQLHSIRDYLLPLLLNGQVEVC